jgi:hypothetical protein
MKKVIVLFLVVILLGPLMATAQSPAPSSLWDTNWPVDEKLHTLIALHQGFCVGITITGKGKMGEYLDRHSSPELIVAVHDYLTFMPKATDNWPFFKYGMNFMDDYFTYHKDAVLTQAFLALILRWHDITSESP